MSAEVVKLPKKKRLWERLEKSLFRYLPTGEIYVRKTFHKELLPDLNANTHETTIGKARRAAELLIAEHRAKHKAGIVQGRTIGDVIEEVLRVVTPERRARTQEQHRLYLNELKEELGHFPINEFSRALWYGWLPTFKRKKDRTTFSDYAKNLNLVLRYAYQNKMASHLVTIPNPDPVKDETGRVFTPEEIERLFEHATGDLRVQLELCYRSAMRLREALYLEWSRVNLDTGLVTLKAEHVKTGSRTGKGRSFILGLDVLSALRERKLERGELSPYVFPSPHNPKVPAFSNKTAWRTLKEKAGIKGKARWHDLRHTALSHMLLIHRLSPVFVSKYAGVSIRTIERVYLHATAEDTKDVANALGSRNFCKNSVNGGKKS